MSRQSTKMFRISSSRQSRIVSRNICAQYTYKLINERIVFVIIRKQVGTLFTHCTQSTQNISLFTLPFNLMVASQDYMVAVVFAVSTVTFQHSQGGTAPIQLPSIGVVVERAEILEGGAIAELILILKNTISRFRA